MSNEAIYGQPVPGNLHEENASTFECSPISLVDRKTMFANWPVIYQSGHVEYALQLVATKLPAEVASCDKALTIHSTIHMVELSSMQGLICRTWMKTAKSRFETDPMWDMTRDNQMKKCDMLYLFVLLFKKSS